VTSTEVSHSQHIISELLEVLIESNELGLTISEIEGDAILFYMHDQLPDFEGLLNQARNMFLAFHSHLRRYERDRICRCGACSTASGLTLKIIAHCGDLGFITVQDRRKPHGEDVILSHLLLKNTIGQSEYLLLTETLYDNLNQQGSLNLPEWAEVEGATETYDGMGQVPFYFIPFKPLNSRIPEPPPLKQPEKIRNPVRAETKIYRNTHEVYEIVSNLDLRLSWNKGVRELDYEQERVNRSGTRHVCLIGDRDIEFETVKNEFGSGRLVYGERLINQPFMKQVTIYYIMEPLKDHTKLIVEAHYHPKPPLGWFMIPLLKQRFRKLFSGYLPAIKEACERNYKLLSVSPT